jgi:hypothetical protein
VTSGPLIRSVFLRFVPKPSSVIWIHLCITFHKPHDRNMNNSSHHAIFRAIRSLSLTGAGFLRVNINQNCITAQASGCFVPWLPHPRSGQSPVVSLAMHEPPQRLPPSSPFQLPLHGTSLNVPSIAPRPSVKNAPAAPESMHRSKLP